MSVVPRTPMKFEALIPNMISIVFEYADRPTMELKYHDFMMFSVVGDDNFPATGPLTYWEIREHYGVFCALADPDFKTEFLEEYHPLVHIFVELPWTADSFINWLKVLGDVSEEDSEEEWPSAE